MNLVVFGGTTVETHQRQAMSRRTVARREHLGMDDTEVVGARQAGRNLDPDRSNPAPGAPRRSTRSDTDCAAASTPLHEKDRMPRTLRLHSDANTCRYLESQH